MRQEQYGKSSNYKLGSRKMARYKVGVTNARKSAGIGPAIFHADSPEEAWEQFLKGDDLTEEKLEELGFTEKILERLFL